MSRLRETTIGGNLQSRCDKSNRATPVEWKLRNYIWTLSEMKFLRTRSVRFGGIRGLSGRGQSLVRPETSRAIDAWRCSLFLHRSLSLLSAYYSLTITLARQLKVTSWQFYATRRFVNILCNTWWKFSILLVFFFFSRFLPRVFSFSLLSRNVFTIWKVLQLPLSRETFPIRYTLGKLFERQKKQSRSLIGNLSSNLLCASYFSVCYPYTASHILQNIKNIHYFFHKRSQCERERERERERKERKK